MSTPRALREPVCENVSAKAVDAQELTKCLLTISLKGQESCFWNTPKILPKVIQWKPLYSSLAELQEVVGMHSVHPPHLSTDLGHPPVWSAS